MKHSRCIQRQLPNKVLVHKQIQMSITSNIHIHCHIHSTTTLFKSSAPSSCCQFVALANFANASYSHVANTSKRF